MAKVYAEPVFPNAGVEAWYAARLQWIVHNMASDLLKRVRAAWAEGIATDEQIAAELYAMTMGQDVKKMTAKPTRGTLLRRALGEFGTTWTKRIDDMSASIARDFALKNKAATSTAMRAKLKKAGFAVQFKLTDRMKDAYAAVVEYNVGLIKSIPQEYLTDVQTSVWQSVISGHDLKTLTDDLQDKYEIAWKRAALIASDQNSKAKAVFERTRRLDVGIKRAKWLHSHAGKVPRPTHVKKNGKSYDVAKGWYDPDADEYIWPGTLIKCRCADAAEIPGFET